jgi:hypothetical protein
MKSLGKQKFKYVADKRTIFDGIKEALKSLCSSDSNKPHKHKPIVIHKTGANRSRLFPTTMKELKWEELPDEIIIDIGDQSIEEIMKLYPEYHVHFEGKYVP